MRLSVLILILLCIHSCTRDMAGPTTEQGNPQITAVVLDSLKKPVADIPVLLLVFQKNDTSQNEVLATNAIRISTSKSTSDGKCTFSNLSSGNYRIVATDSTRNLSVTSKSIVLSDLVDTSFYDTLVLQKPGVIKGVVRRNRATSNQQLQDGFIQIRIRELEQFFITGPTGAYTFYNLPYGTYSIYYYAAEFYTSRIDNIIVTPGKTTIIDTVTLKAYQQLPPAPANFKAVYDSSSSLLHFSWTAVNFQKLRYYEVNRNCDALKALEKEWRTLTTSLTDTLLGIPDGTRFSYVIHSVDSTYAYSSNAGPIEIEVRKKNGTE